MFYSEIKESPRKNVDLVAKVNVDFVAKGCESSASIFSSLFIYF